MYPNLEMPGGWEWLVILVIVVFVFGASKLPDLARGTGQALRIFKAEARGMKDDEEKAATPSSPAQLESDRAKLAELDARQAELDAERERLNRGESA